MPLGGEDFGYKGFALAMMVEVLALAITGCGRRFGRDRFGQGVFLQVIDPARFAGRAAFMDEVDHLVASIRDSRVRPGGPPIRLPGERALRRRRDQLAEGIEVSARIVDRLAPWAARTGVPLPAILNRGA